MYIQPEGFKCGIYFNLSNEDYQNDPAISCSNIKDLLVSPRKFWKNSNFNQKRKEKNTDAKAIGSALHCYLMERERFFEEYIILPKLEVDSDFYRTESIKPDFLKNFELYKTKDAKTFKYIGDKLILKEEEFDEIKEAIEYLESLEDSCELFRNGYAEVSIFWRDEETGLMCKCRPDWLAINWIADYKSLTTIDKIKKGICDYKYFIQQAFYLEGLNQIRKFLKENSVDASQGVDKKWWEEFIDSIHNRFIFVFQEKDDSYLTRLITFNLEVNNFFIDKCQHALEIYKENIKEYGSEAWPDNRTRNGETTLQVLGFEDLPSYIQFE